MESVFRALGSPVRRGILDRLYERDGQTLTELAAPMEMTRFGAMRHLGVLEQANLIVTRREGREKLHHLNPVPIREIHDRWLSRYTARWAGALTRLKANLEDGDMSGENGERVYLQIYIRTTPEKLWEAITSAEFTRQYFHSTAVESDWQVGSPIRYRNPDGTVAVDGEVVAADPPHRLVMSWHVLYDPVAADEAPSRVTWEIEQAGEACRLRVTHDRFPDGSVLPEGVRDGWTLILSGLKTLLETGEALEVDVA